MDAVGEVKALQERSVEGDRDAQVDVSVQVLPLCHCQFTCQPSKQLCFTTVNCGGAGMLLPPPVNSCFR